VWVMSYEPLKSCQNASELQRDVACRGFNSTGRWKSSMAHAWLRCTQRALARNNDIPLVGALRAAVLLLAVDRGAEIVSPRIYTRSIDIVVPGVVAHPEYWLSRKGCL
jgi:hypothetical protein